MTIPHISFPTSNRSPISANNWKTKKLVVLFYSFSTKERTKISPILPKIKSRALYGPEEPIYRQLYFQDPKRQNIYVVAVYVVAFGRKIFTSQIGAIPLLKQWKSAAIAKSSGLTRWLYMLQNFSTFSVVSKKRNLDNKEYILYRRFPVP